MLSADKEIQEQKLSWRKYTVCFTEDPAHQSYKDINKSWKPNWANECFTKLRLWETTKQAIYSVKINNNKSKLKSKLYLA